MKAYRFAALVHSAAVADIVTREGRKAGYAVDAVVTDLETAVDDARSLLNGGCEVVLCHGHCRHRVFKAFSHVTVFIERSDIDLIKALLKAREKSRTVMLTAHEDEMRDISLMEQLLGMKIHLVSYRGQEEMSRKMLRLYEQGVRVAVGGGVTSHIMSEFGGQTFLDMPHPRNIRNALERAASLAAGRRLEAAHMTDLVEIMQHVKEGVVCIDSKRELLFCNERARRLLKESDDARLTRYYEALFLDSVLRDGSARPDVVVDVAGERLLVNTFPLSRHAGSQGAVSFMHDVTVLQKMHRKIDDALYAKGFVARYGCGDIKGTSPRVRRLRQKIRRYAATDAAVFINGESGTGKELAAHALHQESLRRDKPFVAVNCAALPESLLESELFGYEEGAFTGARRGGKPGLFELADKGTLFLDEIGEISHTVQLRLLRVLEAGEVMRIGGERLVRVDVRILSASHQSLADLVRTNRFRMDLYYRLAGLNLKVPPLREHPEDIPLLLADLFRSHGQKTSVLTPRMMCLLKKRSWPGNVRELFAFVGGYLSLLEDGKADNALFDELLGEHENLETVPDMQEFPLAMRAGSLKSRLAAFRGHVLRAVLQACGGDRMQAARTLSISASTLHRILESGTKCDEDAKN